MTVLPLLFVLFTSPADPKIFKLPPPAAPMGDLSGIYSYQSGKAVGSATVTKIGDVYHVVWVTHTRGDDGSVGTGVVTGTGIVVGDVFSVGWSEQGPRGITRGVTTYRLRAGPGVVLDGRWASLPGGADMHAETLRLLGAIPEPKE